MSDLKTYRVGDVVELVRDPVVVKPEGAYTEIGVRSFGRGIFHKEPVTGADLGNKKVYWIRPGELVFNTVFAWEGAVAVSSDLEKGKIGSHRFMTYRVNDEVADLRYLYYYFSSERGLATVAAASPGSAGRNRTLGIKAFAGQRIELPGIEEQRRIVAKLDRALRALDKTAEASGSHALSVLLDSAERKLAGDLRALGWTEARIEDVAEVNPRRSKLESVEEVLFVPMASVDDRSGVIRSEEVRTVASLKSGYTQFKSGDVIFARITPCMQNGKSAVVPGEGKFAYGSTEFHVIRSNGDVSPEWIHFWVRRSEFRFQAKRAFTGTAGQQRVPADFLRASSILIPPSKEAERYALRRVDELVGYRDSLTKVRDHATGLRKALRPSLLNAAFSGQL